jgi:L-fuconolactonase
MTQRIDAHHHFWNYSAAEYGWISDEMRELQRDFLAGDLQREMAGAGVDGAVTVQARQTLEETRWLLRIAEEQSFLRGVVGWAPLASADFPRHLEELAAHAKLKGLRHVIQDEPDDDFMLGKEFNRGISALAGMGLVYDILIFERHLRPAAKFVDRHPNQIFVLDHLAKPLIRQQEISPWREHLRELAARPHVYCKFSGLATEADWHRWTIDDLRPYFEIALECFGPERLLAGSDWPVCLLATSYGRWWQTLGELVSALTSSEQAGILGENAVRVYSLQESRPGGEAA